MIRSCALVLNSLVAVSFLASAGCASRSSGSDDGTAAAGSDAAQVESDSESFGSMFASSGGDGALTPSDFSTAAALRTQGIGGGAANGFPNLVPSGCVTETSDAPSKTNTYVFDNCTGPYGFVHLKGTVTVTWSSTGADNLTLNFAATNFEINKAVISDWKASADITATGDDRDMQWNGQFSGTTGGGRAFSRTNTKDIKWTAGKQCVAIDGQSTGNVTGKNLTTKIVSYQRCAASCPEANSEIDIHNDDNGNEVDVVFEGGAKADVTLSANGKTNSIDIALPCQ